MSSKCIGDHVELQRGTTYKSALLDLPGPYLLGLGSIARDGGFRQEKLRTYGGPSPDKLLVYPGDMFVSLKDVTQSGDLLGSVARVPPEVAVGRMTQDTVKLSFKTDIHRPFFYWVLRSPQYRQHCRSHATGTTNLGLSREDFFAFEIPELDADGEKIVDLLEAIEEKIELNRQTNQTLEQIAQALFKSWFVDFEPTRAKIAAKEAGASPEEIERAAMCAISGKTPAQLAQLPPETQQNLKTTATLFPDALVESELGEVPEGWGVSNLKSVTTEIRRGISPAYVDENGVCVINQKCIRNHKIDFSLSRLNDPIKKKVEDRLLQVGDVLVNSTGVGTLGRLAPIRYLHAPTVHDSHVTVVRADTSEISKSFLIGLMLENESFIEASGIGSTGQTELNRQVLENISFAKPKVALGVLFESIVEPMNRQIAIFEQQGNSLTITRNTLLPKLLCGELGAVDVN